jgi:alpha/beta superfamily hydrolase
MMFNNQEVDGEFLQANDANHLVIFLPPDPAFGGSMNESVIEHMFIKCRENNLYALRLNYHTGSVERMMLQSVIAIEEAKAFFSSVGSSMYNIWLVGLSIGATVAFNLLQRRIDIHGIVMISPLLKDCDIKENENHNIIMCYSDVDPLTSKAKYINYINQIKPIETKCFKGADHTMRTAAEEVANYVIGQILSIDMANVE